jgi:hypothetical protein
MRRRRLAHRVLGAVAAVPQRPAALQHRRTRQRRVEPEGGLRRALGLRLLQVTGRLLLFAALCLGCLGGGLRGLGRGTRP